MRERHGWVPLADIFSADDPDAHHPNDEGWLPHMRADPGAHLPRAIAAREPQMTLADGALGWGVWYSRNSIIIRKEAENMMLHCRR
jgi:hypothetical protein